MRALFVFWMFCMAKCFFNNVNLIGLEMNNLKKIIGIEPTGTDQLDLDDGLKDVLEFDPLSLQVYVKNGKVISVDSAGPYKE